MPPPSAAAPTTSTSATTITTTTLRLALFFLLYMCSPSFRSVTATLPELYYSDEQQPLNPGNFASPSSSTVTTMPITVPAIPVDQAVNQSATCRLDLSNELFGGVGDACVHGGLDRSRCCPVLAAWLFAAHARSALEVRPSTPLGEMGSDGDAGPMMPDDNQRCVDSLQSSLARRDIRLPQPNATCDTVLCFCGIRLHQLGSLRCPAAFNISMAAVGSGGVRNPTPTAAVRQLERDCRNASYAGCTRCLHSLEKLRAPNGGGSGPGSGDDRATRMFRRDCQLMGLTWLLAKNRTAYIPTVSAVLRAILYSAHPATGDGSNYKCSPDQENMPLAVDSLQFQHLGSEPSSSHHSTVPLFVLVLSSSIVLSLLPLSS